MKTICPYCRKVNDMSIGVGASEFQRPAPGDVSICIGCGNAAIFDPTMSGGVSIQSPQQRRELDAIPEVARAQRLIRSLRPEDRQ